MMSWLGITTLAAFDIVGVPAPQGSKTRMPNGALVEGGSATGRVKHRSWRAAVTETAQGVVDGEPFDGPLALGVTFRFPMPKSRPRAWQVSCTEFPRSTKPDLDKLVRALCDGLTDAGLIRDDARIFHVDASKVEVVGWAGASVVLRGWAAS